MACDTRDEQGGKVGPWGLQAHQRLNEQQKYISALFSRVVALERQANPLEAFEEDHLDAAPLLAEVERLTRENRELRDALRDAHQNAEALVLVTKQVIGRGE